MKVKKILEYSASLLLKVFVVVALYFPVMTSYVDNQELNGTYPEKILVNFMAVLFMICFISYKFMDSKYKIKNRWLIFVLVGIIIIYIDSYLSNMKVINWVWQARNTMISFGLFLVLTATDDKDFFEEHKIKQFTIWNIVVSHLLAIIVYFKGYLAMHMYDAKLKFIPRDINYYEKRFNWIYSYKCQFAMMLLLFLSFIIVNKNKFKNKFLYGISLCVIGVCLVICNTKSAIAMGLMVFLMDFIDVLVKSREKRKWIVLGIIPIGLVGGVLFRAILKTRNVGTIGGRLLIWPAAVEKIKMNLNGLGLKFTHERIQVNDFGSVTNGHNIFLNEILRLGVVVGMCFTAFILVVLIRGFFKRISFFNFGVVIAFMIQASMDYAILPSELTMVMFMLYCIFYLPYNNKKHKEQLG